MGMPQAMLLLTAFGGLAVGLATQKQMSWILAAAIILVCLTVPGFFVTFTRKQQRARVPAYLAALITAVLVYWITRRSGTGTAAITILVGFVSYTGGRRTLR